MLGAFFGKPEKNLDAQNRIEVALDTELQCRQARAASFDVEQEFYVVQQWQARRLLQQYEHLFEVAESARAAQFMLSEVYSGDKLASISQEVRKTARKAWRLAPADMIDTAAEAIEAHLYTQQFDESVAVRTLSLGGLDEFTGSEMYILAMQGEGLIAEKRKQLLQMRSLASNIERYLNKSSFHLGLKMTSKIAQRAGVYNLHQFLVNTSSVLKNTQNLKQILDEITMTELALLDQISQNQNPFRFMDMQTAAVNTGSMPVGV